MERDWRPFHDIVSIISRALLPFQGCVFAERTVGAITMTDRRNSATAPRTAATTGSGSPDHLPTLPPAQPFAQPESSTLFCTAQWFDRHFRACTQSNVKFAALTNRARDWPDDSFRSHRVVGPRSAPSSRFPPRKQIACASWERFNIVPSMSPGRFGGYRAAAVTGGVTFDGIPVAEDDGAKASW